MGFISFAYATYTTISPASIASGQPVSTSLMQQIKDNLDDLNSRVNNKPSLSTISASIPVNQNIT
jgi:hypothetical protein